MKKNKILFLVLALILSVTTIGCSNKPQKPMNTKNQLDKTLPNNRDLERNNENTPDLERNIKDNMPNKSLDEPSNMSKRDTTVNPNKNKDNNLVDKSNDMSARANSIARKVTDLNEVNSCSVLLAGNTCIVGVNIKNNVEGKTTSDLKQKIEKTVKNADNKVKVVSVTADPDIYKRISNMATDISNGNPISGFTDEFEEILRRITPVK